MKKMNSTNKRLVIAGIFAFSLTLVLIGTAISMLVSDVSSVQAKTVAMTEQTSAKEEKPFNLPVKLLPEKPKDTQAPVITVTDVTEEEGTEIDVLADVTVTDNVDKNLEEKIVSEGTFDINTPGDYVVTLSVTDQAGNTGSAQKHITITPTPEIETPVATPPTQFQQAPVENTTPTPNESEAAPVQNTTPSYSAMTMYIAGTAISYQNGGQGQGQSIIDSNSSVISTWGGAAAQSGSDGLNTHFIGHNPGIFSTLFSVGQGSQITVTDGNGTPTIYTVSTILTVDDSAVGSDGTNYWSLVTGTGGGERITLQTCIDDYTNRIVIAYA